MRRIAIALAMVPLALFAQKSEEQKYMRSSLCMMMVEDRLKLDANSYNKQIEEVFKELPIPNRFNDHGLGARVISFANSKDQLANITAFGKDKQIAKRMVSKWFGRKKDTGFNTELLRERGLYSATKIDVKLARQNTRGMAMLEDLGENLIGHTYWLVNDIKYVDRSKGGQTIGAIWEAVRKTSDAVESVGSKNKTTSSGDDNDALTNLVTSVEGFSVKVKSYLFRLKWNDEVAGKFYVDYYTEDPEGEADKLKAFREDTDLFTLEYVGMVDHTSSNISAMGLRNAEDMIRKATARSLDKSLADLQHNFADFRIKAPLVSVSPLKAYVGLKEDINKDSRYEVLETVKDERGITRYKRVGVIKPVKGKIWDNQYMADQEPDNKQAQLDGTEFEKVSGGEFRTGMLIREFK